MEHGTKPLIFKGTGEKTYTLAIWYRCHDKAFPLYCIRVAAQKTTVPIGMLSLISSFIRVVVEELSYPTEPFLIL
ncbi:hypothetical protein VNO77_16305 [Canavalia gladiata]|uniref:Uncharacterized protein n=1 Tax=Canavalia gladiata TaxID=3824 RepID=A0AAN9QPS9_CANGL